MKVYTHEDVLKLMNRIHVYEINRDLCMLKLTPIDMEEKLLEYWNGGIKSTEEGGKSFDQYHNEHHEDKLVEIPTSSQTEISDEMSKIEKALYHAWSDYEYKEGNLYSTTFRDGWLMAIDWYKKQLNNK